jgi:hypothetical protein
MTYRVQYISNTGKVNRLVKNLSIYRKYHLEKQDWNGGTARSL